MVAAAGAAARASPATDVTAATAAPIFLLLFAFIVSLTATTTPRFLRVRVFKPLSGHHRPNRAGTSRRN
ncbi:hypothetical protein GCM10023148_42530 [Actinokineospora soli]